MASLTDSIGESGPAPQPRERVVSRVLGAHQLTSTAYELVLERQELAFLPGMNLILHGADATEDREYSIASGVGDPELRILYRRLSNGRLTSRLASLRPEDTAIWSGPYGTLTVRDPLRPLVYVATGTGISPCRSYVRSFPELDATILHGVREEEDLVYADEFARYTYVPCVTRPASGRHYRGRVTDWLAAHPLPEEAHYYLCGAFDMVHDVTSLLTGRGVDPGDIFTEAYYYGQPE